MLFLTYWIDNSHLGFKHLKYAEGLYWSGIWKLIMEINVLQWVNSWGYLEVWDWSIRRITSLSEVIPREIAKTRHTPMKRNQKILSSSSEKTCMCVVCSGYILWVGDLKISMIPSALLVSLVRNWTFIKTRFDNIIGWVWSVLCDIISQKKWVAIKSNWQAILRLQIVWTRIN